LHSLEQKKLELNAAQSEIQTLKYEQTSTASKVCFYDQKKKNFPFTIKSFYLVRKIRRNE
jgi:hypothetical protein